MTQSLRARLLLGVVVLTIVGLGFSDIATYKALEAFLEQRVDQQLVDSRVAVEDFLIQPAPPGPNRTPSPSPGPTGGSTREHAPIDQQLSFPKGTYAALLRNDGSTAAFQPFGEEASQEYPKPALPAQLQVSGHDNPTLFTTGGSDGVDRYRVLAQRLDRPDAYNDILVLAIPLSDIETTLGRLLLIEALISLVVLALIAALGFWIVRAGLSPLEKMAATASAIAAGELSRRVEPATPSTEIGRLGLALNSMLSQIESAFRERSESEQRLRRFVGDASHELRTPLTSIRGYAELMRRRPAPPAEDIAVARRRIEEESIRMSEIVNDMLLLARLDQGRPLENAPVDLAAIAQDACADARAAAPERPISLSAQGPVIVDGDDLRLRQVVANLLRNAIVHTPRETPIDVAVRREDESGQLVVADHGPGLAPEYAEKVFEPFFRADPGRSRDRGGSGLGLSIVAAVVAAHHGRVSVAETEGGGATFTVELPLLRNEEAAAPPPEPSRQGRRRQEASRGA